MMKPVARFSVWVLFAGILCFAPSAFSQGPDRHAAVAGNGVLNLAPSSFLAFTLGPGGRSDDHDGGNGCGNQGGGGWGGGWDGDGWGGGGNGGGGCSSVPEGGTALMYLSVAGLCCLGALALRSRKQAGVSEAK
jgi:hypothetical protein